MIAEALCVFQPSSSSSAVNTAIPLSTFVKQCEERKRKWQHDAPQSVLCDDLMTKIFLSTGLSTKFLDNPHVHQYHQTTDEKYSLPS